VKLGIKNKIQNVQEVKIKSSEDYFKLIKNIEQPDNFSLA
jgi:hypothetical protein